MRNRLLNTITHKIYALPVLVLMPHSRCNCRCVMCDIWKANHEKKELSTEMLEQHLNAFKKLGVKRVALSGGEALMHSNLWKFCDMLHSIHVKISLLSTGITLKNHAVEVIKYCDDVIVSLDGSREVHNAIRNIPSAFEKMQEGVRALKNIDKKFKVSGRTVLQKQNFSDINGIILAARELMLDQISFLAADVSSEAFNRPEPWQNERASEVALNEKEVQELEALLNETYKKYKIEFESKFIAESRDKLLDICRYYRALNDETEFPKKKCNAPWVSAVIESNGDVLPCFFHKPYGNIHDTGFEEILNSEKAVLFRKNLDVHTDSVCQRCVCSLNVPALQRVF